MGATTIETITVTRPMKVIAFTLCSLSVILLLASLSAADWVQSDGWREGLFVQCTKAGAPTPLPFDSDPTPGCKRAHSAGYVRGAAALGIICFITNLFATTLTGLGLRSTDPNKKYKYYRVAIYALAVAVIALFLACIIYPTSLAKDIENAPRLDGGRVGTRTYGSLDFDGDGTMDHLDDDDDNDGIVDDLDPDDDNDGIPDDQDDDDDNDGIKDDQDGDVDDFDRDGVPDHLDTDDDNDGIADELDRDDDNDGIIDILDTDDDNDGIPDALDNDSDNDGIIDALDKDDDGDGIPDAQEQILDADADGIPDSQDTDDDNDGIPDILDTLDSDGDGISDDLDVDDDGDGVPDHLDQDDDGDGIPDSEDISDKPRVWEFGFGYGCSWCCLVFMFVSLVLLICDRESEEIFYKEREAEEGDEEEA